MAETPRLDLPYLSASQAQKEIMHNVSLDRLDLLVQCTVLDRNLTAPPASPTLGDAYIVGPAPTGVWAGHANALALYINLQWQFIAPLPGFQCWVLDEAVQVGWSGSAWTITASGGAGATTLLGLTDTPDSYGGQAGKTLLVNPGETGMVFGTVAGSAPVDATYIVSSTNATLSAERVVTNNSEILWDTATAGQLQATVAAHGVTLDKLAPLPEGSLLGRGGTLAPLDDVQVITVGAGLAIAGTTLTATGSGGGGSSDFLGLSDTPDTYSGQAGKIVQVNAGATGLEFGTVASGVVTEAEISLSDVTADNASTTQHGFLPKLSGVSTEYMNGTGGWSTPAAGGGGSGGTTVGATVTRSTSHSVPSATLTPITWTAETRDDANFWASSPNPTRLSIPVTGWYTISLVLDWDTTSVAHIAYIRVDGTTLIVSQTSHAATDVRQAFAHHAYFTAGQYLELVVYAASSLAFDGATCSIVALGGGSGAATSFLALTDTPDTYAANALKILRVNAGATATEFGPVLGSMAQQDASAVAITGGAISIGGHAPTGVLDVQGSVAASDKTNEYYGVRVWPTAPSGTVWTQALRVEAATGAGVSTAYFAGLSIENPTTTSNLAVGINCGVSAGTGRYNINASGGAQNYFGGHVGIFNATPSYPLDVTGNVRVTGTIGIGAAPTSAVGIYMVYNRASGNGMTIIPSADTGGGGAIGFHNAGSAAVVGSITTTSSATAFNTSSDVRLKHSIAPLTGALDAICRTRPITHLWNADDSRGYGFLAHELQREIPDAVTGQPDEVNADGSVKPQQVDHSKLVPWLTACCQELAQQVQALTARVASLEEQLGVA